MVPNVSEHEEINVVASAANWAWPNALQDIFRPRGVNLLVADETSEFITIIEQKRIHTTIVDMDSEQSNGLATVRVIKVDYPQLPCIILATDADEEMLGKALELDVFGVIGKPVDIDLLRRVLHRLFMRKYNSYIFQ